jgi:hypothetical protein
VKLTQSAVEAEDDGTPEENKSVLEGECHGQARSGRPGSEITLLINSN